jgi:adenosylcobyric acid synthase
MGRSSSRGQAKSLFRILRRDGKTADAADGLAQPDGRAWGTYIHGVFDNDEFRSRFLRELAEKSGKKLASASDSFSYRGSKDKQFDLLADLVRQHVDVRRVLDIVGV